MASVGAPVLPLEILRLALGGTQYIDLDVSHCLQQETHSLTPTVFKRQVAEHCEALISKLKQEIKSRPGLEDKKFHVVGDPDTIKQLEFWLKTCYINKLSSCSASPCLKLMPNSTKHAFLSLQEATQTAADQSTGSKPPKVSKKKSSQPTIVRPGLAFFHSSHVSWPVCKLTLACACSRTVQSTSLLDRVRLSPKSWQLRHLRCLGPSSSH